MNKEKCLTANYEEYYEKVSVIDQQRKLHKLDFYLGLLPDNEKIKILDLGCAEGKLAVALAEKGHDVTGADISQAFLDKLLKLASSRNIKIKTVKCNIEEGIESFKNERYDLIYFMDVIEHLKNPSDALTNIRKLLKESGHLIIHTPNSVSFRKLSRYLFGRNRLIDFTDPESLGDLHLVEYDVDSLTKFLSFIGFRITEVVPTSISLPQDIRDMLMRYLPELSSKEIDLKKRFLFLNNTILVICQKSNPINVDEQIRFWNKTINK